MELKTDFRIVSMGDSALTVEFEARIDPAINARAIGLAETLQATAVAGVRDIVPTYRSVAVYFDPLRTNMDGLFEWVDRAAAGSTVTRVDTPAPIQIPVCYGGDFGPDLPAVAKLAAMSLEEVVRTHTASVYRVFMLGFVPGFAYMGRLDPRIAAPRHPVPRLRVPTGSVGIAGEQTGIYPRETPGGWQLIGRTAVRPFDLSRPAPFLFKAGDSVRFVSIDRGEYEHLSRQFVGSVRP